MANQELSKKPLFNLSKVLQETGIKADTLRAWERRYQLPVPSRTEGGHRLFSSYDIETIRWLQARQEEGLRISQAVDYWRELIAAGTDPLAALSQNPPRSSRSAPSAANRQSLDTLTREWIDGALNFDCEKAEQALDAAFEQYPWEIVCTNMIFQGLSDIGEGWYKNEITVQQEHFASQLVVQKLNSLIASAPAPYHPQNILIVCPPGEYHTIAPLMINTLLRYRGWETTYLGANVPLPHLEEALDKIQPTLAVMISARLQTAASILIASQQLQDREIPLAFGGNIFQEIPALVDLIPGTYLGTDFGQAVSRIETLLSVPEPPRAKKSLSTPYQALKEEFEKKLLFLENQAVLTITGDNPGDFPAEILKDANEYLFQDILAALTLGEINHIQYNFDWMEGLIKSRPYELAEFVAYLETFIEVSKEHLSEKAQPLLDFLSSYLSNHYKESHS